MKNLSLFLLVFSILSASDNTSGITRYSDLSILQKKNVSKRFEKLSKRKGLRQTRMMAPSERLSHKEFIQLRSEIKNGNNTDDKVVSPLDKLRGDGSRGYNHSSFSNKDENLHGRWNEDNIEEAIFIELSASVTVPPLDQMIGSDATLGNISVGGDASEGTDLIYMIIWNYQYGGSVGLSNEPWFGEISDDAVVYDLWFRYWDDSIDPNDDGESYVNYLAGADLRFPTSGYLYVYSWNEESINVWIPFGAGAELDIDEGGDDGDAEFGGGFVALAFDGAGGVAISDALDSTNVNSDSYSVSDDGMVTVGDEEGPQGIINSDGSVLSFMDADEESGEGLVALGFKLPNEVNLALSQGNYFGVGISMEIGELLGVEYEYPLIQTFSINYDGSGNYTLNPISGFDNEESFGGTYFVQNGLFVFDDGEATGVFSSDSAYAVYSLTHEDDSDGIGLLIKEGSDKSVASLNGIFTITDFSGEVRVGTDISIEMGFSTVQIEFDGSGNYTVSDDEGTETGAYDVSSTGVLIIEDEEVGFVGSGDDVILIARTDGALSGSAGVGIKKSTGMSNASLAGNYGMAFLEFSSDGGDSGELVTDIEGLITLDFVGEDTDSSVNAELIDDGYDDEGYYYFDFSFPTPTGITVSDLELKGFDDYSETEVNYSFEGQMSYEQIEFSAGEKIEIPQFFDFNDYDSRTMEFQGDKFGREIITWSYDWEDEDGNVYEEVIVDSSNFVWNAENGELTLLVPEWYWDDEEGEEFQIYRKIVLDYSVIDDEILIFGGDYELCQDWTYTDSWEQCIEEQFPFVSLVLDVIEDDAIEKVFGVNEETFLYDGSIDERGLKVGPATLPLAEEPLPLFMQDIEVSGNRLYGGGLGMFTDGGLFERYLRILDISDPARPKELNMKRPSNSFNADYFDMEIKDNVLITNDHYGPNFYNVESDKILDIGSSYNLTFDGSDDYVDLGAITTNFAKADFSVQAWVQTTSNNAQGILLKSDGDDTWEDAEFHLYLYASGDPSWVGWGRDYIQGNKSVNDGNWHHVVVVWDYSGSGSGTTGTGKMYVDGVESTGSSSYNADGIDLNSNKIYIAKPNNIDGSNGETRNYFDGSLKEIAIWSQALTATEVSKLYNNGSALPATEVGLASDRIGYWKLNEGSSVITNEVSSNEGTLYGGSWYKDGSAGISTTECCYGIDMSLKGNKLYVPIHWWGWTRTSDGGYGYVNDDDIWDADWTTNNSWTWRGFRILDVTAPKKPSVIADVKIDRLVSSSGESLYETQILDIGATDSHVYILDWPGTGWDTGCTEGNAIRIFNATSPYSEVGKISVGDAAGFGIHGSFLYTTVCGEFKTFDISDPSNVTEVATLSEPFAYYNTYIGEIEKFGNYVYLTQDGWADGESGYGVDIIDVTHHTEPVHIAAIPGDKHHDDEYDWETDTFTKGGGFAYPVQSVEVSNGHVYVPQQSSNSRYYENSDRSKGSLRVYQSDFAPEPFKLMFPPDQMEFGITEENVWGESFTFAWTPSADVEESTMNYTIFFDEGLDPLYYHILDFCEDSENFCTIPLHRLKDFLYIEGLPSVSGVWDVMATDGVSNTFSFNGPFKLTIDASSVSISDEENLPVKFALHENYPNPFNPTTRIRYDLPQDGNVKMVIYDLKGRKIRDLINRNQNAGFHLTTWDGTNNAGQIVSTGVYIYQIRSGSFIQSKKMLLMK